MIRCCSRSWEHWSNSMKDCTERYRAGVASTSAAALILPRCIQIKTSVSKITVAATPQAFHDLRDRLPV